MPDQDYVFSKSPLQHLYSGHEDMISFSCVTPSNDMRELLISINIEAITIPKIWFTKLVNVIKKVAII